MKNDYKTNGKITIIYQKHNDGTCSEIIIDAVDLLKAQEFPYTWFTDKRKYVYGHILTSSGYRKKIYLHRWILGYFGNLEVDHINRNRLDNRRKNLRIVTRGENRQNLGVRRDSGSGLRGLTWCEATKKWRVRVRVNGKITHLGYFRNKDEAVFIAKKARAKLMPFSQEVI